MVQVFAQIRAVHQPIRSQFLLKLTSDIHVNVSASTEQPPHGSKLEEMADSLAIYFHSLRNKELWDVQRIHISERDEINTLSGRSLRGEAFPKGFILYPILLTGVHLWGENMGLSGLRSTSAHECTHVNRLLERFLLQEWITHSSALSWERLTDKQIITPGGAKVEWFNSRPANCPSEYAALFIDEDIAESVVAFLFARSKLDSVRRQILSAPFTEDASGYHTPKIEEVKPDHDVIFADPPSPVFKQFFAVLPTITLQEMRASRGIA